MGGDWVTNGVGKASGLWGATMCGSSQLQLPVRMHLHAQGGVLMYRPPYDHHGLCLQVDKMIYIYIYIKDPSHTCHMSHPWMMW